MSRRLFLSVVFGLVACGGAFADAVKRGDQYAQAGMWDKAAAEYRTAQQLEPGNTDVAIKLRQASQQQASERLVRANSLMARGEIEAGLAVIQEAARLTPDSTEALRALDEANQVALARAKELLETSESRKAFDLTQLVLAGSPNDPRARRADDEVRDALADQAYGRAEQFADAGRRGNALIEYAACMTYRPGFRDAKVQLGDVKLALQRELTFHVVLERLAAAGMPEQDLVGRMKPELIAQAFDERVPLRVATSAPGGDARGVRVAAALSEYRYGPVKQSSRNDSCDYIKGYDTVPNPTRAEAERSLNAAEQRLAQSEREVDDHQRDVDRYQKDVDSQQKDLARYESDVDRVRGDYEQCMAKASSTSPSSSSSSSSSQCNGAKSQYDSAQHQVQNQRNRVQSAQSYLGSARDRMRNAADSRNRARQDVENGRRHMRDVPAMIQQPHHERENYRVDIRSIDAQVTLTLHIESLPDKITLLDHQAFPQVISPISDDGWLARPATCPAQGKRLDLPNEFTLRADLVKLSITTLREKLQTLFESYRTKFLADARRQEAGGAPEDAVESYVRYLLTGIRNIDPADGKQISEFLRKTRGFGKIELLGSL